MPTKDPATAHAVTMNFDPAKSVLSRTFPAGCPNSAHSPMLRVRLRISGLRPYAKPFKIGRWSMKKAVRGRKRAARARTSLLLWSRREFNFAPRFGSEIAPETFRDSTLCEDG